MFFKAKTMAQGKVTLPEHCDHLRVEAAKSRRNPKKGHAYSVSLLLKRVNSFEDISQGPTQNQTGAQRSGSGLERSRDKMSER